MTSGPSAAGVAELRNAAAALKGYTPPTRRRRWPRWLTGKRLALILVADLILGSVAWHYLTAAHPTAVAQAVEGTASDAAHNNWTGVYGRLCSSDRAQFTEPELAEAGQAALLGIGELNHVTVTGERPVTLPVGPFHWPAEQVSGDLVPVIGAPSPYTVVVVRQLGGWKMCLSPGGYSSTAMSINVPLGGTASP